VIGDLPTHDHASCQVNHHGKIKPDPLRAQIRNVTNKASPWLTGSEITSNEILGILIIFSVNRGDLKSPWLNGFPAWVPIIFATKPTLYE